MKRTNSFRLWGQLLQAIGIGIAILGAVGLVIAAVLPWVLLTVFRTPVALPGILGFGFITAAIGLLALAQFGIVRRFPLLGIVLGITAWFLGVRASGEIGAVVMRQLLHIETQIAPINARLAELSLPPIEPFGSAVGARKDHIGIGPRYTEYAGATLTFGSLLLLVGGRLRRTCRFCRRAWSVKRGDEVAFCPHCGKHSGPMPTCPRCAAAVEHYEKFCVRCGENLSPGGNKTH